LKLANGSGKLFDDLIGNDYYIIAAFSEGRYFDKENVETAI
jgi:hypothetical protein